MLWLYILCFVNFSALCSSGEKDQLGEALRKEEVACKSYSGEADERWEEVSRLRAEIEKMKTEHAAQISQVTESASAEVAKAAGEFEAKEKKLSADIVGLREENMTLRDAIKTQKDEADIVAQRMAGWLALAKTLNEKMEG